MTVNEAIRSIENCMDGNCSECRFDQVSFLVCEKALLKEVSAAIEDVVNVFPKSCRFCVGCELESVDPDHLCGADGLGGNAFVLSTKRARDYLAKVTYGQSSE